MTNTWNQTYCLLLSLLMKHEAMRALLMTEIAKKIFLSSLNSLKSRVYKFDTFLCKIAYLLSRFCNRENLRANDYCTKRLFASEISSNLMSFIEWWFGARKLHDLFYWVIWQRHKIVISRIANRNWLRRVAE